MCGNRRLPDPNLGHTGTVEIRSLADGETRGLRGERGPRPTGRLDSRRDGMVHVIPPQRRLLLSFRRLRELRHSLGVTFKNDVHGS